MGFSHYPEDGLFIGTNLGSNPPLSRHRKSLAIDFLNERGNAADRMTGAEESSGRRVGRRVRRPRKSESNFMAMTPEMASKGDATG